jgi:protein O-GlcNAc transferase
MTPPTPIDLGAATALHRAGLVGEAEALYRSILDAQPDNAKAAELLAVLVYQRGAEEEAVALFHRAIAADPDCTAADTPLGRVFHARGDFATAVICHRRAVRLRPNDADAHADLGRALHRQHEFAQATISYRRAVALRPQWAEVYSNLADALRLHGRLEEAQAAGERALALNPGLAEAHNNLANALREQGKPAAAAARYERALALRPDWPEAHNNLANALNEQGRSAEAVEHYERALALNPDLPEVYNNLGNALAQHGRADAAIAAFDRALALKPDYPQALVQRAHLKAELCDWHDAEAEGARVLEIMRQFPGVVSPWTLQGQPSTPSDQLLCAQQWSRRLAATSGPVFGQHPRASASSGKIRLGYLSADFRDHPVGYAVAETIERHDRSRFEVIGYSHGPDDGSELRRRFEAGFDRFLDLRALGDREAAAQIHSDRIDILIDLTGYTSQARPRILAVRPAPIQVNCLGFLGTMGADFIDYIIVDRFIAPASQQPFYSEKLVHLAGCWWPAEIEWEVAQQTRSRSAYGLPQDGFVFCCFNTSYKITPPMFDIWARLLRAVPGSVLWLAGAGEAVTENLRREARLRGLGPDRLVFAARDPMADYLGRHRHADLFLDTRPYNATGTAYHALLAGLPVLTCAGETFAGRTAGTMLLAAGLPELVTASLADYERVALQLAGAPDLLAEIRQRLARSRTTSPLFDPERYVRDSEGAFVRMWEIWCAGDPPTPFSLPAFDPETPAALSVCA